MKLKELFEAKVTDKQHIQRYTDLSRPLSRALYKHHIEAWMPTTPQDGCEMKWSRGREGNLIIIGGCFFV